jgi:hypothetical protein
MDLFVSSAKKAGRAKIRPNFASPHRDSSNCRNARGKTASGDGPLARIILRHNPFDNNRSEDSTPRASSFHPLQYVANTLFLNRFALPSQSAAHPEVSVSDAFAG